MNKENKEDLLRKEKRVKNAINSQSKRLKLLKGNGANTASIERTLKNSKDALIRIQTEIDTCDGKKVKKPKQGKESIPILQKETKKSLPKGLVILAIAIATIVALTLAGV